MFKSKLFRDTYKTSLEDRIMSETQYSPLKHFLFHLPEFFYFLIKIIILFFVFEMVVMSMAYVVAVTMLEANDKIQCSDIPELYNLGSM